MAEPEQRPGMIASRIACCDRASRILTRAESELRQAWLPESARQRATKAFEQLKSVCAAFGSGGRDE